MPDAWLQLIPVVPDRVPDAAAADAARARFAAMVGTADEVLVTVTDDVNFIDSGDNHERIGCPACEVEIDEGWWVRALYAAGEGAYTVLDVTVPCCRARLSLNDLVYDWPAGFARFVLEALNPEVGELDPEQLQELSTMLGTPLRMIRTHI